MSRSGADIPRDAIEQLMQDGHLYSTIDDLVCLSSLRSEIRLTISTSKPRKISNAPGVAFPFSDVYICKCQAESGAWPPCTISCNDHDMRALIGNLSYNQTPCDPTRLYLKDGIEHGISLFVHCEDDSSAHLRRQQNQTADELDVQLVDLISVRCLSRISAHPLPLRSCMRNAKHSCIPAWLSTIASAF